MRIFEDTCVSGKVLPLEQVRMFLDFEAGWSLQGRCEQAKQSAIRRGEEALERPIPMLPASLYRQFGRTGSRSGFEAAYFERRALLHDLLYAEAIEGNGRFYDRIIDLIWAVLEESTWVLPAHNPGELCGDFAEDIRNVDIFSAATAALLTLSLHLLGEGLDQRLPSQLLTRRIRYEIQRRVLGPVFRYDMSWMCRTANNWNPWIFSNVLFCMTMCEEELAQREALLQRILQKLDNFVARYGEMGGCDEGPRYWEVAGGCFFDCLELVFDLTGGQIDFFTHPFVRRMGEYIMHMHICGDYFVPFADAPHKFVSSDAMIARFGHRTGSRELERFGLSRINPQEFFSPRSDNANICCRVFKDAVYLASAPAGTSFEHAPLHYFEDIQVMVARQFPQPKRGLFAAIKGGCNGESHNHNDVGTFVVYYNGEPFLVDAGVDTYSRITFSPQRYTLWYMQSSYHNLPDINGSAQREGSGYRPAAVCFDPDRRELAMELRTAYPAEARIRSFHRSLRMERGQVKVEDVFDLEGEGTIQEHYLFQERPDLTVPGILSFADGPCVYYDPKLQPSCEEVSLLISSDLVQGQNPRGNLACNWGKDFLYRVTLAGKASGRKMVCQLVVGFDSSD